MTAFFCQVRKSHEQHAQVLVLFLTSKVVVLPTFIVHYYYYYYYY